MARIINRKRLELAYDGGAELPKELSLSKSCFLKRRGARSQLFLGSCFLWRCLAHIIIYLVTRSLGKAAKSAVCLFWFYSAVEFSQSTRASGDVVSHFYGYLVRLRPASLPAFGLISIVVEHLDEVEKASHMTNLQRIP